MLSYPRLDQLKVTVRKTVYSFLKNSIANALVYYKYDISDKDMSSVHGILDEVEKYFDQFVLALYIGFAISTAISALCYVISIIFVTFDYRKKVLMLRQGIWPYRSPRSEFAVNGALNFVGAFLSNSVLGFLSIMLLYGCLLTPLCYSLFWIVILLNIKFIALILAPGIAQSVVFLIYKKLFSTQHFITWRLYPLGLRVGCSL